MAENRFSNGMRAGRTEATLEDVRSDIAELKPILQKVAWRVSANTATICVLSAAVGFLFVALIRGWL